MLVSYVPSFTFKRCLHCRSIFDSGSDILPTVLPWANNAPERHDKQVHRLSDWKKYNGKQYM